MRSRSRRRPIVLLAAAAVVVAGVLAAAALGEMKSTKLEPRLCETTGGGRFVKIPGFPGEKIDRRLLADIEYLVERYDIFITDGYSTSKVHAKKGEHPIGLALDIVPDTSRTKRWRKVTRLAKWAEPKQNHPRPPFRWVGYNGDVGHGRGDHLHLSWSHSPTEPKDPARTVYTIRCPEASDGSDPDGSGGVGSKIRAMQRTAVPEKH